MAEEVVQSVLGKRFQTVPAVLTGYRRICLKQRVYPAIIKGSKSETISGKARNLLWQSAMCIFFLRFYWDSILMTLESWKVRFHMCNSLDEVCPDYEDEYLRVEEQVRREVYESACYDRHEICFVGWVDVKGVCLCVGKWNGVRVFCMSSYSVCCF